MFTTDPGAGPPVFAPLPAPTEPTPPAPALDPDHDQAELGRIVTGLDSGLATIGARAEQLREELRALLADTLAQVEQLDAP